MIAPEMQFAGRGNSQNTLHIDDDVIKNACMPGSSAFYHWRSAGGAEVDLLLERDGVFYPFEIKMTANPTRREASGLMAFR